MQAQGVEAKSLGTIDTLRERLVARLMDLISSGALPQGTRLYERRLADEYGVSRGVVREALRVLEGSKFVTVIPRQAAVVASLSKSDIQNIYEVRAALESAAVERFGRTASDADIDSLANAVEGVRTAAAASDIDRLFQAKTVYYDVLLGRCGNPEIKLALEPLNLRVDFLRRKTLAVPGRVVHTIEELEAILNCLRAGNADGAASAARLHVMNALDYALRI